MAQHAKFGSQMVSSSFKNRQTKDDKSVIIDNKKLVKGAKSSSLVEDFDSYSDDEDIETGFGESQFSKGKNGHK